MENRPGRNRLSHRLLIWAAIVFASLTLVAGRQACIVSATLNDPNAAPRTVSPRSELWPDEKSTIGLFKQASPAVVNITAIGVQRDLFTLNLYEIPQGTGSGLSGIPGATSSPISTPFRMPMLLK
jgi:hypothetical protein